MTAYETSMLLQAQACMARVEGMKAENVKREQLGQSLAYGEEAFFAVAREIDWFAGQLQYTVYTL